MSLVLNNPAEHSRMEACREIGNKAEKFWDVGTASWLQENAADKLIAIDMASRCLDARWLEARRSPGHKADVEFNKALKTYEKAVMDAALVYDKAKRSGKA